MVDESLKHAIFRHHGAKKNLRNLVKFGRLRVCPLKLGRSEETTMAEKPAHKLCLSTQSIQIQNTNANALKGDTA